MEQLFIFGHCPLKNMQYLTKFCSLPHARVKIAIYAQFSPSNVSQTNPTAQPIMHRP
jgi:hypothetical protein